MNKLLVRWPLRLKLVALTALLLAMSLALISVITSSIVSRYLVNQVDEQLLRTASNPALLQATAQGAGGNAGPSDYYILIRDDGDSNDANSAESVWGPTRDRYGVPRIPLGAGLPVSNADSVEVETDWRGGRPPHYDDRPGRYGNPSDPFTVPSYGGAYQTDWRVVAVNISTNHPGASTVGMTVYLGLPLAAVEQANSLLNRVLLFAGLGIIASGGLAAFWLVRHSMAPLRQIETTASDIATHLGETANNLSEFEDGPDALSERVPITAPPGTEVGSLQLSLNTMLSQIQQSFKDEQATNARMRRFVSDASHELRTPLAVMKGYSELYRIGGIPPGDVPSAFERVEDAATQMTGLVEELLTLARLDEGQALEFAQVNLTSLAETAASDLHALDPARPISLKIRGSSIQPNSTAPAITVDGDTEKLSQTLTNLIGNVTRYTAADSPCEITLIDDANYATISVIDHGPGVTPGEENRIFDRFYRTDSSRNRQSGGTGLGLAIVAAIAAAHHGTATATPTPGGGLTVTLSLPKQQS